MENNKKGLVEVKVICKSFLGPTVEYTVVYDNKEYKVMELNRQNSFDKLQIGNIAYLGILQGE